MSNNAKYGGDTNFFQQECMEDKSLRRARVDKRLLFVLLITDVVLTVKGSVLQECVIRAPVLVGHLAMGAVISDRKKDLKGIYLKARLMLS